MTENTSAIAKTLKSRKLIVKIVAIVLIVCIVCGLVILGIGIYIKQSKKDRAVIILPGLFASGLYDTATGKDVWDPFTDTNLYLSDIMTHSGLPYSVLIPLLTKPSVLKELEHITANDSSGDGQSFLSMMAMNEDGTPAVPTVKPVPFDSESRLRYGVVNAQTDMYNVMEEAYGATHEVQVFNYDFRLDNRYSGQLLEEYINKKGYKDVILVSHSNGGEVAACYLGRSQKNRDKVSLNLSIDSPYYGSFSAITIIEDMEGMIAGLVDSLSRNNLTAGLADTISKAFDSQFKPLANMWAVYQLMPSFHLLKTQQYYYKWDEEIKGLSNESTYQEGFTQSTFINIDGEDVFFESEEELFNFYCSRPWAKTSTGELRTQMLQWRDYQDSMMVETENGKVHSTSLVNSQYFSGMGYGSIYKVFYNTVDGKLVLDKTKYERTEQGDGTVLLYSATAGTMDSSRIHIIPYANHYDVVQRFNEYSVAPVMTVMDNAMSGWNMFVNKIL